MWGTFLLDVYRQQHARAVRDALEAVLDPNSGSGWAAGGVYVFLESRYSRTALRWDRWRLPERFAQHNGLRGCPASGCKDQSEGAATA